MKKTQWKDTLRNVRKQGVSYLSIIVIAMLAVMAYLGINFASKAISENATRFYQETNFRDVEIISTLLLSEDDLNVIRNTAGVADAESVLQTSGRLVYGDAQQNVDIVSLTERINTPKLVEGGLPRKAGECMVEQTIAEDLSLSVGCTITLQKANGETPDFLRSKEFVITGIVLHPDHACFPLQVPGNRNVILLPSEFDTEATDDCYMKVVVSIEGAGGKNLYEKPYLDHVSETVKRLEELGKKREKLRSEDVRGKYQAEIDEGQSALDEAQEQLQDASDEIERNQNKLNEGEQELSEAKEELDAIPSQLEQAERELDAGREELERGQEQASVSREELRAALKKLKDGEAQIAASKRQLDHADAQLKNAKAQLDDAWQQLQEGKQTLDDSYSELQSGRTELIDTYRQVEDGKKTIREKLRKALYDSIGDAADNIGWYDAPASVDPDDTTISAVAFPITNNVSIRLGKPLRQNIEHLIEKLSNYGVTIPENTAEVMEKYMNDYLDEYDRLCSGAITWDEGHTAYLDGKEQYQKGLQAYNEKSQEYQTGLSEYQSRLSEYQLRLTQYNHARSELDAGWQAYYAGLEKLRNGESELSEGEALYESKQQEYEDGVAAFEEGKRRYEEGEAELESGRAALEEGRDRYEENYAAYESGAAELADAQAALDDLSDCRWVVLDVSGNASYVIIQNSIRNVRDMGLTFSLVFVLVGALVIYTTVGRIVDEQRKLVGTEKALGLYQREIMAKYLFYGISGTVLGMLLGLVCGYIGIQRIMLYTYGRYYVFESGALAFRPVMTLIVFAAGIVLSGTTVWIACTKLVRTSAISLLQGNVPHIRHIGKAGQKKAGSLYSRMVWLNMISDKNRVIVSVASIAGCCALLVAGFSMKYSVTKAFNRQYDEIELYDMKVSLDPDSAASAAEKLQTRLKEAGVEWTEISDQTLMFNVGGKLNAAEVMCGDIPEMNQFFAMHDIRTNKLLSGEGEGIWIHKRTAEKNDLKAGDTIILYDINMEPHTLRVAGIFNIFAGRQMILSKEYYKTVFGRDPVDNMFLIRCGIADGQKLIEQIQDIDGLDEISGIAELRETLMSFAGILNLIALMFTVIAGMMAYFILLNIVNMYVNQKKYELIIMRINGFTVREVLTYVSLELIVSTAAGIVLGWAGGSLLAYRVIRLLESAQLQFDRSVQWSAWLWAALITILFSAAISFLALRKIPRLKLTDAS